MLVVALLAALAVVDQCQEINLNNTEPLLVENAFFRNGEQEAVRRALYEVSPTDEPGVFHVERIRRVGGERIVVAEFDTVLGLLLQTEYQPDRQRPILGRNYRRQNDFGMDMVGAIASLTPGDRLDFTAVERSRFGMSSDRVEVASSVEFLRCETIRVGGEYWPVNVYHVVSGGRSRTPSGENSVRIQEKTVYMAPTIPWPVRTETDTGVIDAVDIQSR